MSNVRIELFFSTVAEAAAFLAGREAPVVVAPVPVSQPEPATEGKARKAKEKPAAAAEQQSTPAVTETATPTASDASVTTSDVSPTQAAEPEQPKADEKPAEPFPYATLQKAVVELVALPGGRELAQGVLAEFGVASFKGSDPAIWAKAKERLDAVAAKAKAEGEMA